MFRLAALNNQPNVDATSDQNKGTKEAQEVQAFGLYNEALQLQRDKFHKEAIDVFEQLLKTSLVTDAASTLVDEHGEAIERPLKDPGLILKYSTHKNLASMTAECGDINTAMEHYLQAVMLDTTDVTLWYRIGSLALKLSRLTLARHAFTSGLTCNENHWPCLDASITVLFALLNYESCLYWISKALEKEPSYTKGLVLRSQMYKECPHLKKDFEHLFRNCSFSINSIRVRQREAKQYVAYAMELREEHRKLCVRKPIPDVDLTPSLSTLTWVALGESLVSTYHRIANTSDETNMISKVLFGSLCELEAKSTETMTSFERLSSCDDESTETETPLVVSELSEDSTNFLLTPEDLSEPPSSLPTSFSVNSIPACDYNFCQKFSSQVFMTANIPMSNQEIVEENLILQEEDDNQSSVVFDLLESLLCKVVKLEKSESDLVVDAEDFVCENSVEETFITEAATEIGVKTDEINSSDLIVLILDDIIKEVENISQKRAEKQSDEEVVYDLVRYLVSEVEQKVICGSPTDDTQSSTDFEIHPNLTSEDLNSEDTKVKRGSKRKRQPVELTLDILTKRRSTRVRTSTHKKRLQKEIIPAVPFEPEVDYKKELIELLPHSMQKMQMLKQLAAKDNNADKQMNKTTENPKIPNVQIMYNDYTTEAKDVLEFLRNSLQENDGILDLLRKYSELFSKKSHIQWPEHAREILVNIFGIVETNFSYPHLDDMENLSTDYVQNILFTLLNHVECEVDCLQSKTEVKGCGVTTLGWHINYLFQALSLYQYFQTSLNLQPAVLENSGNTDAVTSAKTTENKNAGEVVEQMFLPSDSTPIFPTGSSAEGGSSREWKYFLLRLLFTRSKYLTLLGQNQKAIFNLETCQEFLAITKKYAVKRNPKFNQPIEVHVPNMKNGPVLSEETAQKQIDILKRAQVLEDVKDFFDREQFKEVVNLLQPTLVEDSEVPTSTHLHRARQLRQLLVSYEKLGEHLALLHNASSILNEVLANARNASLVKRNDNNKLTTDLNLNKEWNSTLVLTYQTLNRILSKDASSIENLDKTMLIHLSHTICSCIDFVMVEMEINRSFPEKIGSTHITIHMWITLYKLVKTFELDLESKSSELPCSLMLLDTAHQWLGDRGMCCSSNAALLRFHVKEIEERFPRMKEQTDLQKVESLNCSMEQNLFCMYGYPAKVKSRKIQEHLAKNVTLKWPDFMTLFCYFCPSDLPEFDSFKASTVSTDLSQLILRGLHMVPESLLARIPNTESEVISFIEHDCDITMTSLRTFVKPDKELNVLADLYYLLGDFNLKNREINKAMKYYLLDIRIHPNRFDSWAGMALARSSQIEDRLRLCESKKSHHKFSDSGTERRAMAALACFKRALSIESDSVKLWIEYGSLAYWIQSMYSRKLKRRSKSVKGDEQNIEMKQKQMINIAKNSFNSAKNCDSEDIYEEEWLANYMLGKLAEKEGKPPSEFLNLYYSAAELLHNRGAKYPKKILAKYGSVAGYAIEALEMYFRVHASVLKYILRHEDNIPYSEIKYMAGLVKELANSPFVMREDSKSVNNIANEPEKAPPPSKLTVSAESTELTMGSLLPDSVVQALHIQAAENSPPENPSLLPPDDNTTVTTSLTGVQCSITSTESNMSSKIDTPQEEAVRRKIDCDVIVATCETALKLCAKRFPLHNKSIYRLAHLYASRTENQLLQWSVDLILGTSSPWQQLDHMPNPGLLSDRNKTNIFNGVWRIPVDDIDRPGSFSYHLNRCVSLLLNTARKLAHSQTLLYLHNMLNRNPDHGKRYLRDEDRVNLARRALVYCRAVLNRKLRSLRLAKPQDHTYHLPLSTRPSTSSIVTSSLLGPFVTSATEKLDSGNFQQAGQFVIRPLAPDPQFKSTSQHCTKYSISPLRSFTHSDIMTSGNPSSADECLSVVIEAYKVYQDTQKHPESTTKIDNQADPDDVTHQRLLADAYHKYTCLVGKPSISTSASPQLSPTQLNEVLEQAIKFCQQYITQKKQAAAHSSKSSSSATSSISGGGGGKSKTPEPPKDHTDVARVDSSEAAANHVKELSLTSPKKATEEKPEEKRTLTPSTSSTHHTNGQEGLTMVEKDGRQYTRIAPPSRTNQNTLTQSPQSAFTSTHKEGERDNKRIKMDPKLGHLVIPTKDVSSRGKLVRSTSVPVTNAGMLQCFTEDSSNSENKPPVQHRHRLIARTSSSVSDYTKIKLKLSILAKTSASLVRKPSITDQEMMQITNDPDAEESSSGSEDEDEMGDGNDWRGKRKFSEEPTPSLGVNPGITSQLSPINSVVITTAGST